MDRYRIASARLVAWDYAAPGFYFVTWCTAHRRPVLGRVEAARMWLSPLGALVEGHLADAVARSPRSAFVVMPDHVHLLVEIAAGMRPLGAFVGDLKGGIVREARRSGRWDASLLWQSRYWDRVVRDEAEAHRIRAYIADNPRRWHARRAGETPVFGADRWR